MADTCFPRCVWLILLLPGLFQRFIARRGRALARTTWILPLKSLWSSIALLSSPIVANPVSSPRMYVVLGLPSHSLSVLWLPQHKLRCLLLLCLTQCPATLIFLSLTSLETFGRWPNRSSFEMWFLQETFSAVRSNLVYAPSICFSVLSRKTLSTVARNSLTFNSLHILDFQILPNLLHATDAWTFLVFMPLTESSIQEP